MLVEQLAHSAAPQFDHLHGGECHHIGRAPAATNKQGDIAQDRACANHSHHDFVSLQGEVAHLGHAFTNQVNPVVPISLNNQLVTCGHLPMALLPTEAFAILKRQVFEQGYGLQILLGEQLLFHAKRQFEPTLCTSCTQPTKHRPGL